MAPAYSVIVPVYNVEKYLRACVDSILGQTFRDFELILVDDGSPDSCPAICDEYAARYEFVSVVHQENRGLNGARLGGFAVARAEYICFVDSDDTVAPDWLERIDGYAAAGGRPDMLIFGLVNVDAQGNITEVLQPRLEEGLYDKQRLEKEVYPYFLYDRRRPFLTRMMTAFAWAKVYKRHILEEHFLSDPRIRLFEDIAMTYECVYFSESVYVCHFTPYFYRLNEQSLTKNPRTDFLPDIRLVIDYLLEHLGSQDPALLDPQINANMVMRIIDSISREIQFGYPFKKVLANFRSGMERSRLYEVLICDQLPFFVRVFVRCLKWRLYWPAVAMAEVFYHRKK